MTDRKKISILYPFFFPGYKAGGITQSLYNLSAILGNSNYQVQIICLNHDFCDDKIYVFENGSNEQSITEHVVAVYLDEVSFFRNGYKAIKAFNPDYIYVNSVYNAGFLSLGAMAASRLQKQLVIAPRGMLHQGGLQKGTFKKRFFLNLLKTFLPVKRLGWHATDEQEVADIKKWFGEASNVHLASDTPRPMPQIEQMPTKSGETLKLVYYSLITSKKNLLLLLEALSKMTITVTLDIYGPIIEADYWQQCLGIIEQLPANITVTNNGNILFNDFARIAQQYHFLVLPSKGENFGHVIYEGLSLGLPVIISRFTPWQLEGNSIGFYVDLDTDDIANTLYKAYQLNAEAFRHFSDNARAFASNFYDETVQNAFIEYQAIFSYLKDKAKKNTDLQPETAPNSH